MYNFGRENIYKNCNVSTRHNYICNRLTNNLRIDCGRIIFLVLLSISVGATIPVYRMFFVEKELLIPIIFPFTDPDTEFGFYLNTILHLMVATCGFFILPGAELFICIGIYNNITSAAAIIENEITELENQFSSEEEFSNKSVRKFINIILQKLDLNR